MGKMADESSWCGMDKGQMVAEIGYGRFRELLEGNRRMEVTG